MLLKNQQKIHAKRSQERATEEKLKEQTWCLLITCSSGQFESELRASNLSIPRIYTQNNLIRNFFFWSQKRGATYNPGNSFQNISVLLICVINNTCVSVGAS